MKDYFKSLSKLDYRSCNNLLVSEDFMRFRESMEVAGFTEEVRKIFSVFLHDLVLFEQSYYSFDYLAN